MWPEELFKNLSKIVFFVWKAWKLNHLQTFSYKDWNGGLSALPSNQNGGESVTWSVFQTKPWETNEEQSPRHSQHEHCRRRQLFQRSQLTSNVRFPDGQGKHSLQLIWTVSSLFYHYGKVIFLLKIPRLHTRSSLTWR
jgi:hypothetical protein